ncbi:MAG: LEA type 2 family protein [Polyangiaceae bacterium]|nr:LEA type 2 family protein [Polyangiaceae bacterium]
MTRGRVVGPARNRAARGRAEPRAARGSGRGEPIRSRGALSRALGALAAALVLATLGAGCVHKPTMELAHAQVSQVGPSGIVMTVYLRVNNPNGFDVQIRNVRVESVVQGRWALPPVAYSPNQWLPGDGTTIVEAPVVIPWPLVMPLLAETVASPSIKYRVRGQVDVTAIRSVGIQSDNYPVDETGSVPRGMVVQAAQTMFPYAR